MLLLVRDDICRGSVEFRSILCDLFFNLVIALEPVLVALGDFISRMLNDALSLLSYTCNESSPRLIVWLRFCTFFLAIFRYWTSIQSLATTKRRRSLVMDELFIFCVIKLDLWYLNEWLIVFLVIACRNLLIAALITNSELDRFKDRFVLLSQHSLTDTRKSCCITTLNWPNCIEVWLQLVGDTTIVMILLLSRRQIGTCLKASILLLSIDLDLFAEKIGIWAYWVDDLLAYFRAALSDKDVGRVWALRFHIKIQILLLSR